MKQSYFTVSFLLIFLCFSNQYIYAQITFGANTPPVKGALLQLKDNDNIAENSTKGMMLPRVKLEHPNSLQDIDPDNLDRPDPDMHVGLTVYSDFANPWELVGTLHPLIHGRYVRTCPGVYVWNKTDWKSVMSERKRPVETGSTLTDTDGNVYTIHTFGDAGTWMTQNLRRKLQLPCEVDSLPFLYPNNDRDLFERHPEYGLLYKAYRLTGNKTGVFWPGLPVSQQTKLDEAPSSDELDYYLTKGSNPESFVLDAVQSVCPDGWHLPTDREWTMLEKEFSTNRHKYSTELSGTIPWDSAWEDATKGYTPSRHVRGDYGWAMINPDIPENAPANIQAEGTTHGTSNIDETGFNAHLIGWYGRILLSNPIGYGFQDYGTKACFAVHANAVSGSAEYYMTRVISWGKSSDPDKGTNALGKDFFMDSDNVAVSVRCKKNDW